MSRVDTENYAQSVEDVMHAERGRVRPYPLRAEDQQDLFREWCRLNPKALRHMELTAIAINNRGMRVSTKYLIEKQRYEGVMKLVSVPFTDQNGLEHHYSINNSDSSLLSRWLLAKHPDMRIETRRSMFDTEKKEKADE